MTTHYLLDSLIVNGHRLISKASPAFHERFLRDDLITEYDSEVSLKGLDNSILAIPFLLNVIPLVWLSGETYYIQSLDVELAGVLDRIHGTFRRLYPECAWNGELIAEELVQHLPLVNQKATGLLFSGGLDSIHASLMNQAIPQVLIKILTAPHPGNTGDEAMNSATREYVQKFAEAHGHRSSFVTSNVFSFISTRKLTGIWPNPMRWLIEAQYGLGFVGLTAPVMHSVGLTKLLMAGCELDHYGFAFGSHPDIVNTIRWSGVEVVEEGLGERRQKKIRAVHEMMSDHREWLAELKTCLHPNEAFENCCVCSKCLQTIVALIGEGGDPRDYGFQIETRHAFRTLREQVSAQQLPLYDVGELLQWIDIQMSIREFIKDSQWPDLLGFECRENVLWFMRLDLVLYFARFQSRQRRALRRVRFRVALFLDAWPVVGNSLRRLLRPLLRWR